MPIETMNQNRAPDQTGGPDQTTKSDRWHDHLALIPWSAGLLAAGYYQSDLAHQTFGWAYPWAFAFPLANKAHAVDDLPEPDTPPTRVDKFETIDAGDPSA